MGGRPLDRYPLCSEALPAAEQAEVRMQAAAEHMKAAAEHSSAELAAGIPVADRIPGSDSRPVDHCSQVFFQEAG